MTSPISDDEFKYVSDSYAEFQEHVPQYEEWQLYADGEAPEVFISEELGNVLDGLSSFSTSYSHIPVDVIADRLNVASFVAEDNDTATERIKEIADGNKLDLEEPTFNRSIAAQGIAYVIVYPDDEGNVQLYFNTARQGRMFFDPSDSRIPTHFIKAWSEGEEMVRADLYFADRVERFVSDDDGKTFEPYIVTDPETGAEESHVVLHPWLNGTETDISYLPVFAFSLGRPYGKPVHFNAIPAQNALTKLQAVKMAIAETTGFPPRVALMEDSKVSEGTAAFTTESPYNKYNADEDTDERVPTLTMRPGDIAFLNRVKSIQQFTPSSTADMREDKAEARQEMADACGIPLRYFSDPGGQMPAANSQRQAEIRLINNVNHIQKLLAAAWADLWVFVLYVDNHLSVPDITVNWETSPVVITDPSYWEAATTQLTMGVPKRQILLDAGYAEELVASWGFTNEAPNGGVAPNVGKPANTFQPQPTDGDMVAPEVDNTQG